MPPAVCGRNDVGFLKLFFFPTAFPSVSCGGVCCVRVITLILVLFLTDGFKATNSQIKHYKRKRASSSDSKLKLEKSHSWEILLICIFTC